MEDEVRRPADMAQKDEVGRGAGADFRPVALAHQRVQPLDGERGHRFRGGVRRLRDEDPGLLPKPALENFRPHFKPLHHP